MAASNFCNDRKSALSLEPKFARIIFKTRCRVIDLKVNYIQDKVQSDRFERELYSRQGTE